MVIFNLQNVAASKIGMVLTIWKGTKKPKIVTKEIGLSHVKVLRVVAFDPMPGMNRSFLASGTSAVEMLCPEALVAVLDSVDSEESLGQIKVDISEESVALINDLKSSGEWWHPPIEEEPEPKKKSVKGRKPPGSKEQKASKNSGGAKKKDKKTKDAKGSEDPKGPEDPPGSEDPNADSGAGVAKGGKKKCLKKKGVADDPMVAVPENFRKTAAGKELIKQVLKRIRAADQKGFPTQPLFDSEERCLLKFDKCHKVPWSHILERSFEFFRVECLGWAGVYVGVEEVEEGFAAMF